KNTPVHLTVIDQVPLTADGSVDVESELPEDVDHEEATGQLVWEMKLDPSMVWQTEFSYRVRYSTSGPLYLE
ncbi:MAG: DUF4139 domain-containing protein, partial [Lewinella sp.]